jgi:hypothetical protein
MGWSEWKLGFCCCKINYRKGQYILKAMKKIRGNGCIIAAHEFG